MVNNKTLKNSTETLHESNKQPLKVQSKERRGLLKALFYHNAKHYSIFIILNRQSRAVGKAALQWVKYFNLWTKGVIIGRNCSNLQIC